MPIQSALDFIGALSMHFNEHPLSLVKHATAKTRTSGFSFLTSYSGLGRATGRIYKHARPRPNYTPSRRVTAD